MQHSSKAYTFWCSNFDCGVHQQIGVDKHGGKVYNIKGRYIARNYSISAQYLCYNTGATKYYFVRKEDIV